MIDPKFANQSTEVLKKRKRTYNLVTIAGMVIVLAGIALFAYDKETYRYVFYGTIVFYLILAYSIRTWAIQIKKELDRRGQN